MNCMMHRRFISRSRAKIIALLTGILLGGTSPLWALDLFGTSKIEEQQPQAPAQGRSGTLPSLADIAKQASPAVVNVSTTQKAAERSELARWACV